MVSEGFLQEDQAPFSAFESFHDFFKSVEISTVININLLYEGEKHMADALGFLRKRTPGNIFQFHIPDKIVELHAIIFHCNVKNLWN